MEKECEERLRSGDLESWRTGEGRKTSIRARMHAHERARDVERDERDEEGKGKKKDGKKEAATMARVLEL